MIIFPVPPESTRQRLAPILAALTLVLASTLSTVWAADPATPAQPPAATATPAAQPASATAPAPSGAASAAAPAAPADPAALDIRAQELKDQVIRLNRDLLVLEEELLYPAGTQVALFVSMDVGRMFELDSVQVRLDDKLVANYLYTPLEVQALHRGGVQRLFVGNLRAGEHQVTAFFTGKGPHDRDYKRGTTLKFDKLSEPRYIELKIKDSTGKLQPEFEVKVWQ